MGAGKLGACREVGCWKIECREVEFWNVAWDWEDQGVGLGWQVVMLREVDRSWEVSERQRIL